MITINKDGNKVGFFDNGKIYFNEKYTELENVINKSLFSIKHSYDEEGHVIISKSTPLPIQVLLFLQDNGFEVVNNDNKTEVKSEEMPKVELKPFANYESFEECILAQKKDGKSDESAHKICGYIKNTVETKGSESVIIEEMKKRGYYD